MQCVACSVLHAAQADRCRHMIAVATHIGCTLLICMHTWWVVCSQRPQREHDSIIGARRILPPHAWSWTSVSTTTTMCTHSHAQMHAHINMQAHTCNVVTHTCRGTHYTQTHRHTHAHMHTHVPTHARTHAHTCTHTRTHAHTHARTHTRTHTRTHAHTRTYTLRKQLFRILKKNL